MYWAKLLNCASMICDDAHEGGSRIWCHGRFSGGSMAWFTQLLPPLSPPSRLPAVSYTASELPMVWVVSAVRWCMAKSLLVTQKEKKNGRNARAPDMKKCSPLSPFSRLWSCHFTTLHMDSGSWLTLYGTTNPCIKKMQVRTVKKMTLTTSVII
jgi:hypothetical protein